MPTLMKSISGIRGIIGDGLDPNNLVMFTSAFAKFCEFGKIIVGRDARISGDFINRIICGTLIASGCDVIDIGICPTPTVQMYIEKLNASGGIAITASHNPNEWNALKLMNSDGTFLFPDEAKRFLTLSETYCPEYQRWNKLGKLTHIENSWRWHLDCIYKLDIFDLEKIKSKKFKVLLDCVNGAGIDVVPELLENLGCIVTKVNCDNSGIFPRLPEPIPSNLIETMDLIKQGDYDLGIVVDPDVDRLVLITDKGEPFIEENTIVLSTDFVLSKIKGNVCVNLSTTKAVLDIVNKYGAELFLTPVGEINVVKKMKETSSVIGGEGSGGVILPKLHYGRDALVGIVIALQYISDKELKLSEIKSILPQYSVLKNKVEISSINADLIFNHLTNLYSNFKINKEDGLRIDFEDYWIHLRKSNTEPIIRFIVEAKTEEKAKTEMNKLITLISSLN